MQNSQDEMMRVVRSELQNSLSKGGQMTFDHDVVCDEISQFVFREGGHVIMTNREEEISQLCTKGVLMVDAWLMNCASEVEDVGQTKCSIVNYIEKTYGVHREMYVA